MMDALPLHDARKAGLKEGERNKAVSATKKLLEMNLLTVEQIAAPEQLSVEEGVEIKNSLKK